LEAANHIKIDEGASASLWYRQGFRQFMLVVPALLALFMFFVYPISSVLLRSLFSPDFTFEHYLHFFKTSLYMRVLWITFQISILSTLSALIVGYPIAYVLRRARPGIRNFFLLAIALSFMISLLVRNYSWIIVLQRSGVINTVLTYFGLIDTPFKLLHNKFGVMVGMTHIFVPYIVFPIYSVMMGIDLNLEKAAQNLGATRWQTFWRVSFPLSLPGIGAGALLVFIMALGFFITPALLGGRKEQMLSNLIQIQIVDLLNWPFASAMSVILLIATLIVIVSGSAILFLIAPVLLLIPMSLGSAEIIEFPPSKIGLDQYRKFFSHPAWQSAVLNSLQVSAMTAVFSTFLGVLASLGLVWGRFKGKGLINAFIVSPMIVPLIVMALAFYISLAKFGLLGTKFGLVLAYTPLTLPFSVLPISATLRGFDRSLEHAARILGANRFQTFTKVTFPIIRPGVLTGAIFAFMIAFDEVVIALFICGSTAVTLPKKMWDVIRYEIEPMLPAISTLLLLLAALILVLVGLLQQRIARRMTPG
jgi:putative spermidine/putrescine transport system permease protein